MLVENGAPSEGVGKRAAGGGPGGGGKRRRSDCPSGSLDELLGHAGCNLVSSREGHEFEVEDPRKLRRLLEQRLTLNAELRGAFMEGLQEQLGEVEVLHAALKPMAVTGNAPITGDSFVRVLLNVTAVQADVSRMLLERLPEFYDAQGEEAPVAALILGQFRWLDHVADPHWLTERLLEVLPVCPEHIKKEGITFLPEVATEENYEAVIGTLRDMMCEDRAYILPSIEALANLCLTPEQQSQVVQAVLERFQAAEAEDLPAVTRFLLQYAAHGAELKTVVATLRESLHFVSASDPRLAVPDRKGKGAVVGEGESHPEQRLLEALKQAMQLSPAAADAVVREIRGTTAPESHRILDLWLLLAMLTLGADRRKSAELILRRKFSEGHALPAWLRKGIAGHERAMLDYFPQLLALAQQLLRHCSAPVQAAGCELYCLLFRHFSQPFNQQEVLRALHSHLGAQVGAEASAALGVLCQLAQQHRAALMRYAAFLTNILDYMDTYTDQQVHQVFVVFSELVAGACQEADEGGGSDAGGGGRSRMEDELMIFVRKQLSSAQGRHRRVGIIGSVALVQRLGAADSSALESESAIGQRYREALTALKDTFDSCKNTPEAFAFLCDELSRSVQRKAIGRRLIGDLHGLLSDYLEKTFLCFLEDGGVLKPADAAAQVGGSRLQAELWWNLDGEHSPVALRVLPLLAEELVPGSKSAPLLSLFSAVRLNTALELEQSGSLNDLEALLGCPFSLFEEDLADPEHFARLPAEQRRCVLLGLWYCLNWCREVTNSFARELLPSGLPASGGNHDTMLKVAARLRCCCQLEALLDMLLQFAPPLFVLPPLCNTLDSSPTSLAEAAAAAAPKKAPAKGGKGNGGGKKKGVKFAAAAGDEDGSVGGHGGRSGSGTTQHTTSGGGATTNSGGTTTQAGGAAATQAVTVAAADGLGRMAAERWKQRSLLLPALMTLAVGAAAEQDQPCYAMLPSAAYVLSDLHSKLKAVLAPTKRPAFAAARSGGSKSSQLAADLADLTPSELLAAVVPVLPAIRRHLDAACNVFDERLSDEAMAGQDQDNIWSLLVEDSSSQSGGKQMEQLLSVCLPALDIPAAKAALSPSAAASRVRTLALDCVRQLLLWPGLAEPANRPLLQALLGAFNKKGPQVPGEDLADDLLPLFKGCASHFAAQLPDLESAEPTTESPSHQHACLLILDRLAALIGKISDAEPSHAALQLKGKLGKRISRAAESMLKQTTHDPDGKDLGGAAWKGRGPLLADVLRLYLSHKAGRGDSVADVAETIKDLASQFLRQVSERVTGAEAAETVDPFPSLSGATISIWYRVCFEQLQVAWGAVVGCALSAEKSKEMMADGATLEPILAGMKAAAAAFQALFNVIKVQVNRVALHVQAVKSGGKFLQTFLKSLPFWSKLFREHDHTFQSVVKDIQKATRMLQTLCSEGKFRRAMPVSAKVPAVKKLVEQFVFSIKVFLTEANSGSAFWMGTLKHRDLSGREVQSQMYGEEEGDEEEEGEEEEAEAYEDEEMGESQGHADAAGAY